MTLDDLPDDLRRLVIPIAQCWLWIGALSSNGYAVRSRKRVHRQTFEIEHGPMPAGLEPDHLCRVRSCINPHHLEAVTRRTNALRGDGPRLLKARHAARSHCKRGHAFDDNNTYAMPGVTTPGQTRPARACRRCRADAAARYRQSKKEPTRDA